MPSISLSTTPSASVPSGGRGGRLADGRSDTDPRARPRPRASISLPPSCSVYPFDSFTPHYERLSLEFKILVSGGFVPGGASGEVAKKLNEAGGEARVLDVVRTSFTLSTPSSAPAGPLD